MKDFASIYGEFKPKDYRRPRNLACEADAHDLVQFGGFTDA